MFTLRGVAQARHAGRDRCRVRVYATGGFPFNSTRSYPRTRVSIPQEETEFRSDGTNRVIRPARLSLARVSVLRGDGPKEGIPFIDDHIHTSDVIVDYLTEFSGIKCTFPFPSLRVTKESPAPHVVGDLDPHLSRHTLTPLKLVYKKLRLLVDRGCIFIGHGLSKDFRIISQFLTCL
jgi:hypothetical protein